MCELCVRTLLGEVVILIIFCLFVCIFLPFNFFFLIPIFNIFVFKVKQRYAHPGTVSLLLTRKWNVYLTSVIIMIMLPKTYFTISVFLEDFVDFLDVKFEIK